MISVSVVSHGHAHLLAPLLKSLEQQATPIDLLVTINDPELESIPIKEVEKLSHHSIRWIRNIDSKGFGANHNYAAKLARGEFFCILNPDAVVQPGALDVLKQVLIHEPRALAYPKLVNIKRETLQNERVLITPWQLLLRYLFKSKQSLSAHTKRIEWVSGACMALTTSAYKQLGGFDERYFMYCEDVDLCLRAELEGYLLVRANCEVEHDEQKNTLKDWQHFYWHLRSLSRLWLSRSFWKFLLRR